jgi:hypothetical protein
MAQTPDARDDRHMTVTEHIEQNSFAYCDEFPPSLAEGLPLSAALHMRPVPQAPPMKRALRSCVRMAYAVTAHKR